MKKYTIFFFSCKIDEVSKIRLVVKIFFFFRLTQRFPNGFPAEKSMK